MPTSIESAFEQLKQNLEPTGLQKTILSERQQNVRDAITAELTVIDSFLTGSYARHTLIAPLKEADIDIFIVLDPKYYQSDGPTNLLERIRTVLLKTYTKTPKISRNGQAVTIRFSDFVVDVVPAFNRQGGGYLIPNSTTGKWISTNPKVHVDLMTQANQNHNGDLVPIIKMIKGWNRFTGDSFVSFYLEMLSMKIFTDVTISNYPSGIRYFFDKSQEAIKFSVPDPVSYGGQIMGLRGITVADAINIFAKATQDAKMAESYAAQGLVPQAFDKWRTVLGDYFPAYG